MPGNGPQSKMHQLLLSTQLVEDAKNAYSLKNPTLDLSKIHFRAVLDEAVEEFLPQIEAALESIRMVAPIAEDKEKRPRPITLDTWARLEETRTKYDISNVQAIRCVLELLARRYNGG